MTNEKFLTTTTPNGNGPSSPVPSPHLQRTCNKSQLQIATIKMRLMREDGKSWSALRLIAMLQDSSSSENEEDVQEKVQKSECRMRQDVEGCAAFNVYSLCVWESVCVCVWVNKWMSHSAYWPTFWAGSGESEWKIMPDKHVHARVEKKKKQQH